MGNISANSLFHFTNSKEKLISILETGFNPRYCMEDISFFYNATMGTLFPTQVAIPMTCFCDIPLSQIEKHSKNYGSYAIGLSKDWGKENGINPVMYELHDSNPVQIIRSALEKTILYTLGQYLHTEEGDKLRDIGFELMNYLYYLKPYEGNEWDCINRIFTENKVRFYDEREWRYIPNYSKMKEKEVPLFLRMDQYLDDNSRKVANERLKNGDLGLSFKPANIKYIIVEKESEILSMVKKVLEIKARYGEDEKKLLTTKITSLERLAEDF